MKRALLLLAVVAALAASAIAQEPSYFYSRGFVNGRAWRNMTVEQRTIFISGYRDGVTYTAGVVADSKVVEILAGIGITNGELVPAVDRFYSDSLNLRIPITSAIYLAVAESRGRSPEEIESLVRDLRRKYSEPRDAK